MGRIKDILLQRRIVSIENRRNWYSRPASVPYIPLHWKGETYIVDTGHIVAFDEHVGYQVKKVGGLKSTLFSGESLVVELTGPGKAWIQSRSEDAFLSWLIPRLPSSSSK